MNLKKLLLFMLVGIVCSVSVVSAADINDTAVEIPSNAATISVDELQNDITIQKAEENATDENPVQSDENALEQKNTMLNDVNNCGKAVCISALDTDFDFNLDSNTPTIELLSFSELTNGLFNGLKIIHNEITNEIKEKCDNYIIKPLKNMHNNIIVEWNNKFNPKYHPNLKWLLLLFTFPV